MNSPGNDHQSDSAERLRAVLDAAVDGIITIDDRGQIESANQAAIKIFGYSESELVGSNVSKLMPQPYATEHDQYLRNYQQTGEAKIIGIGREVVGERASGEIFPMSLAVGEVNLRGRRLFTGIVRDLSEENAVKAELAEREQQIRFMVENLPAGAVYVDCINQTMFCNRAVEKLTGYRADQLSTVAGFFQKLFGDRAESEQQKYQSSILDGITDQQIMTIETAESQERAVEFTRYHYDHHEVWLVYDRTDELRAAEDVRRERDFVRALLDTAQAVITVVGHDGAIIRCNQAAEALVGQPASELYGKSWCSVFCGQNESEPGQTDLATTLIRGETVESRLVTMTGDDLRRYDLLWWGSLLQEAGPVNEAAVLFGQDVTDFRNAQNRALQAERLAAIGQMVTGLAHESRNALQRAQAGLDVLSLDVPESQRSLAGKVGAAITHVYRLYDEVRDYAAPIQLQTERISLKTVWERAWRAVNETSTTAVRLEANIPDESSLVCEVDPYRIEQVFRNIFENAVAVSSQDDVIQVDTRDSHDGRFVEVMITDCGPGFTKEQKQRVFEPFFTTKQRGTGLGMAIVARVVEEHEGEIVIGDGKPGAAVTVRLPRVRTT